MELNYCLGKEIWIDAEFDGMQTGGPSLAKQDM